jgi:hypothetical protein
MMHTKILKGRELYFSTGKDGKNWSQAVKIAGFGGHNQVTQSNGKTIVTAFNCFQGGSPDRQTNLYLLKSENAGKTWTTIDNNLVNLPLDNIDNVALIKEYTSEKKLVYIKDISFDPKGDPVILILVSKDFRPGPTGDPREWIIVHRKENKWVFSKVCQSFNNYDLGSIYTEGKEWRVIGPTEPGPSKYGLGGEIGLWVSSDEGNTWKKSVDITRNSEKNNSCARRPEMASKLFYSFWTDGDPDKFSECRLYFTDESCKKIWVLPYVMRKDFEKPERIKN